MNVEKALHALATQIEYPAEPDLTTSVGRRLWSAPSRLPVRRGRWGTRSRLVAAAACAALALTFTVSSGAREAVASFLGLDGVAIRFSDTIPEVTPAPEGGRGERIVPGRRVPLELAIAAVNFEVRLPTLLGSPDEVYLQPDDERGSLVSFLYHASASLPGSEHTGIGALLSQFEGTIHDPYIEKVLQGGATVVERVDVDGDEGYFISGGDHVVNYLDRRGETGVHVGRLAGNTLLWEDDGVVYRLEADVGLERALLIALSLS